LNGDDRLNNKIHEINLQVWMDEYKEYIYERKPERFARVDTGDISKQLAIKEKLQCKPFKYFLEVVAPDMLEKYPPTQTEFAKGVVSSIKFINRQIK
jgi:polypeptide N-acetylgalactosaminyltransferase